MELLWSGGKVGSENVITGNGLGQNKTQNITFLEDEEYNLFKKRDPRKYKQIRS